MKRWVASGFILLWLSVLPGICLSADDRSVPPPNQNNQLPPGAQPPITEAPPPQPQGPVRDVFQGQLTPLQTPTGSPDQPVEIQTNLEGITIGVKGSRVVINGLVYKEGEEKMGIKILQIRKKEVDILINQAIKRRLSMLPGETKDLPLSPEESAALSGNPVSNPEPEAPAAETQHENSEPNKAPSKEPTYV